MSHNKSGISTLSVLEYDDKTIMGWISDIKDNRYEIDDGLIQGSKCTLIPAKDGRFTSNRVKVAYAYQILAFEKFGRSRMEEIPSNKKNKDSLVISHLCGTLNCCTQDHFIIESKEINDQRIHCHFCIQHIFLNGGWDAVNQFFNLGGCPHNPRCCTIYQINELFF